MSDLLQRTPSNFRDPDFLFGVVVDCQKFTSGGKDVLKLLIHDKDGTVFAGLLEQGGRSEWVYRATVRFIKSALEEEVTFYNTFGRGSTTAPKVHTITEWQYPLPEDIAPQLLVRITHMNHQDNHGAYLYGEMKNSRKFIFNSLTMNDSDCPLEGALMWISTRTTYVGDQSFVEVYRFKLDLSSLDMTRSFIAPPGSGRSHTQSLD